MSPWRKTDSVEQGLTSQIFLEAKGGYAENLEGQPPQMLQDALTMLLVASYTQ